MLSARMNRVDKREKRDKGYTGATKREQFFRPGILDGAGNDIKPKQ